MKKSLLALAVLGAFAGVASAQSSVTLFGVVDVNARYVDNDGGKQYQMAQDGMNSSRLGFRGTEDLGGGMSAGFWLEGAHEPRHRHAIGANLARVVRRSAWRAASVKSRFGRDYTSTFWNSTIFDPFGTNGVGSSGNLCLVVPGLSPGRRLRHAGSRQQHDRLLPAVGHRRWPVRPAAGRCGRERARQQVLRRPPRLRRGPVQRRGRLWPDRSDAALDSGRRPAGTSAVRGTSAS